MTVDDIIRSALTKLGVIPIGETISAEWTTMALAEINAMLQDWAVEGMLLHALTTNTVSIMADTATYTIGASGTFNVRRPVELIEAVLTVSAGVFRPLQVFNNLSRYRQYRSLPTGSPTEVYYDPSFTLATLTFYPTPDDTYSVGLTSLVSIVPFAASTETIVLPPEYESGLGMNLAVRLLPTFGKSDDLLVKQAGMAKAALFTNNSKRFIPDNVGLDAALTYAGRIWNVLTGSWQ